MDDAIRSVIEASAPVVAAAVMELLHKGQPAPGDQGVVFAPPREHNISVVTDPMMWAQGSSEYQRRPSYLSWGTLRRMASTPLIAPIHRVRLSQIAAFCKPQENKYVPGFQVRMRERRRAPTRVDLKMISDLETFVEQCGTVQDIRQLQMRPSWAAFTAAVMADSLTFDQACFEVIPSRASRLRDGAAVPARLMWVDAATIRLSAEGMVEHGLAEDDFETPRYVQVIEDVVVAEFEPGRLVFGVRNPTTSIYRGGYGVSELEILIRVLTAWLNAHDRNHKYFTQGFNARGLLNLKGDGGPLNAASLSAFRNELQMLTNGVQNSHRLGVISAGGAEWVNLGSDVQDAQWSSWADMQVKLTCALYLMDPTEINFLYGNTGQKAAMAGTNASERVEESKARGLVPLVEAWYSWVSRTVIQAIDADFEIVPTGVAFRAEGDELDIDEKRAKFMSMNEIRARWDLPPRPDGDYVLTPYALQAAQMAQAAAESPGHQEPVDAGGLFDDDAEEQPGSDAGQADRDQMSMTSLQASRSARAVVRRTITL